MRGERYTRVAMLLHWLVALLIVVNVAIGWGLGLLADPAVRPAIDLHKSIGLTVIGLALLRILWRLPHAPPPLPSRYGPAERAGAHAAHLLLYVLIVAIPVTGYLHDSAFAQAAAHPLRWFGLFTVPRLPAYVALAPDAKRQVHAFWFAWHVRLNIALAALFALHVAGVLKHQLGDREPELQRMLPGRSRRGRRRGALGR